MKKIFQIYLADLKRISTNVVAIVIIMGLGIIPALYAWFNIMSNWDPYGEEATSQMHIAVYSEDEGMSVGDLKLCMGDSVIKGLKENDAIGWIFTDSSKEALEYVYSGKYGIGYKKTRRGLVMVIAVEDHKYFIAPGMGLEGELTDVDCDDIARACIVKYMRLNQPGMAVVTVSRSIYNKVKSGRTGIPDVDDGPLGEDEWGFIIFFLIICFGIPIYLLIRYILEECGVIKKKPSSGKFSRQHKRHDDDWFPPFFLGGGGGFSGGSSSGGGFSGGSFGGGSFGGGGSGGGW